MRLLVTVTFTFRSAAGCVLAVAAAAVASAASAPATEPATAPAGGVPAFAYDPSRSAAYLEPTAAPQPTAASAELRKELSAALDEALDGPWTPLYCDYSAWQAGGVGPAAWAFQRPGELLLALAEAAPYMSAPQKAKAAELVRATLTETSPARQMYLPEKPGKPRSIRKTPPVSRPWTSAEDTQRRLFAEAYAVWACAAAFDAWNDVQPCFQDLRALRRQLDSRGDFAPAYKPLADAVLTAAVAAGAEYRFGVYESLISGCQDNYGYHGAREAAARMQKGKPVFFHVRQLAALTGHYRLARHFGDPVEADWARQTFDRVAPMALGQASAAYLWSDPYLVPEVGRLIRDGAGPWLDELVRLPNVGNLPGRDWNHQVVPGKRDYRAINPYTWYHAWGGQGEGVRPQSVLGAFLAHAFLFRTPAGQVAALRDIPWCKADLYYLRKLVAAIQAVDGEKASGTSFGARPWAFDVVEYGLVGRDARVGGSPR